MLTAPRAYFAMAADGLFFKSVAKVSESTRVPVIAIVLQGIWAIVIAMSGRYEQILNYVIPVDFFFIGLTTTCLFRFRGRDRAPSDHAVPGYPWTGLFFVIAAWLIVAATIWHYPKESGIGLLIQLAGVPAYLFWSRRKSA
jgi:APA family basic amino acid/polyamine antiporter